MTRTKQTNRRIERIARNQNEKLAVDEEGNLSAYNPITNMTSEEKALKIQEDIPRSLREVRRVLEERVGLESKL